MVRRLLALVATAVLMLAVAGPAQAGPVLSRAADCFTSRSVCVDPAARHILSKPAADEVEQQIDEDAGQMFVAVLPASAVSEAHGWRGLLVALHERVGLHGTYAIVTGHTIIAGNDQFRVRTLAEDAAAAHRGEGARAVLEQLRRSCGWAERRHHRLGHE